MKLAAHAEQRISRAPEGVFDFACESLPRFLHPVGLLPGLEAVEMHDGALLGKGARRRVTMTDKSTIDEEVLVYERPKKHVYRWLRAPSPFSVLVRSGEADWTFTPDGSGTHVDWVYTFELTTPLVYPLAALVIMAFERWMARGLETLEAALPTV